MKNRRLNLRISVSLIEAMESELNFLGVSDRLVVLEERSIENRSDFLRMVVGGYCHRFLENWIEPIDLAEETQSVPFYLDKISGGLWDAVISDGGASGYNQLADSALWHYFNRQRTLADEVARQAQSIQESLSHFDIQEMAIA